MKKFLIKLLLFGFVFFILDKLFYVFLYVSPNLEVDKRLELLLKGKINKEIIVMGSSRGARNVVASQIEKETSLSAYNISYPGSNIEFHQFLLETLLKYNQKPKIIVLVLDDPAQLLDAESINFRVERLYPLVKYNYINQELIKRGEKNELSWFLCLARINKSNFNIRNKKFTVEDSIRSCGSMPLSFHRKKRAYNYVVDTLRYPIEKELEIKKVAFSRFQNLCKRNDIRLILAFSPNFKTHNKHFENRIKQLSFPKNQFFIYDTTNTKYRNKDYFYDESHLNIKGAKLFTSELSQFINMNK
ncbi:hypothetical protein [Flavobacterium sp. ZB4P13]|uniref:hypothetical protein n=1 Tax=Flavobacterium sp. ZB4P13 TaxID=3401728 RepID=UPI003AAADA10